MKKVEVLQQRLSDSRSKKVLFLSHCILNEMVRYLGGAYRRGSVSEIIAWCLDNGVGIVQLPCPEQYAWGGILKRWLLMTYGAKGTLPFLYNMRRLFLPLFIQYTKFIYWRIAKTVANQINDYLVSGYSVIGIIGIDGSPSCGVNTTLDFEKSFEFITSIEVESVTVEQVENIARQSIANGRGLFALALQKELRRRHIDLPYMAHDIISEINSKKSNVVTLLS